MPSTDVISKPKKAGPIVKEKSSYEPKNFDELLGTPGFSDSLLKTHFKLYEGYVKNTNDLYKSLNSSLGPEELKEPRNAELRRRFGWEFNGMRLHEYYFGNLGKDKTPLLKGGALLSLIEKEFLTLDKWKKEFTSIGAMRGIGWVVLAHDKEADRLFNVWVNEHDLGFLAGSQPLLVMDVFEHAFMADYGLEKDKYISAFWNAVKWTEVERRFDADKKRR